MLKKTMTSLDNALYHARMARIHAESEMSDKDWRTGGVRNQMVVRYDKYGASCSQPNPSQTPSLNSQPSLQLRTLRNLFG